MEIKHLPQEIQNKIFYYYAEHPIATLLKKESEIEFENMKCKCCVRTLNSDMILAEQYERRIKAHKMQFIDSWHRRKYIYIMDNIPYIIKEI